MSKSGMIGNSGLEFNESLNIGQGHFGRGPPPSTAPGTSQANAVKPMTYNAMMMAKSKPS